MAGLAKSYIDIIDESAYGAGTGPVIPLYVIATDSNKVLDYSTGAIAPGTTFANELLVMTSQKDVIDTFGVPNFTEVNGTVMQGDELNEVGLLGLYNAMGSSSLGYVVRADINMSQLKPSKVAPTSEVKHGTKWIDTYDSTYGVFRSNYTSRSGQQTVAKQWDYVDVKAVDVLGDTDIKLHNIVFLINDYNNFVGKSFYEFTSNGWKLIGSEEWKASVNNFVIVNGLPAIRGTKDLNKIVYNKAEENKGYYKCVEDSETHELKWEAVSLSDVGNNVTFNFANRFNVPSEQPQGSIWIKIDQPNDGAKIILRRYNSTIQNWISSVALMSKNTVEAETSLHHSLTNGSVAVLCDENVATIEFVEWKQIEGSTFLASGLFTYPDLDNRFDGKFEFIVYGLEKPVVINCQNKHLQEIKDEFNEVISKEKIENVVASIMEETVNGEVKYRFVIESSKGYSMYVKDVESNPIQRMAINPTYVRSDNWTAFDGYIQNNEPRNEPEDGTLWFNDELKADILVNTGADWKSLKDAYNGVQAQLFMTSDEPESANDMSIWIDTNAENYPTIYRYESGIWNRLDNTDQTSGNGVLFADARVYDDNGEELTFEINSETGEVFGTVLETSKLDPDAPDAKAYPRDMILFNTRFSTNNVKQYKKVAFEIPEEKTIEDIPGKTLTRWVTASGNAFNGAGLFGSNAQRKLIVDALAGAINSCDELKSMDYDFFFATCPGYPELDNELLNLNSDKKDIFYIVSDTPKSLAPTARAITDWGKNANNADHGLNGRVIRSMYMTRQYPPMGMTSNVDGKAVAVPSSYVKMKNLLNLPTGQICAGTQYGVVSNVSSVGYITDEDEYAPVSVSEGLGEAIVAQSINPIMMRRNTGLLLWGEYTENNGNTSLSDEHAILSLLRLKRELDIACTPFFFRKNTPAVRRDFDYVLRTILTSYVAKEEFYDFVLDTETPNTAETISRKELHANIAVEIVKGIEYIYIPIRVVNTGTLSEQSLSA